MENFEQQIEKTEEVIEQESVKEKGCNVLVRIKFIRHGERTKEGELTDYGRELIRKKVQEGGLKREGFDAVKAYGSQAGPKKDINVFPEDTVRMGRALETAHIYTEEVKTEDDKHTSRIKDILNYETIKSPAPYDHIKVYNANLPENYNDLSDEQKIEAARVAQSATVNHVLLLDTPEAKRYKKEVAGIFAKIVKQRIKMSGRLNSGSRVLTVEGTHGPMPEFFLKEALVRKAIDGKEIRGFENIDEIGGPLYPSESIDVFVKRDAQGNLQAVKVEVDPAKLQPGEEMHLDLEKLDELEKFYDEIHGEK